MMMKDMRKLYPDVQRKVLNNLDEVFKPLEFIYISMTECNYALDMDTDLIYEFMDMCDDIKKEFKKATRAMERSIPVLHEDSLPPCPVCGAKVEVCGGNSFMFSSFRVSCTKCRYSLEGDSFPTSDERAKDLARQNVMQTYVAETKREKE